MLIISTAIKFGFVPREGGWDSSVQGELSDELPASANQTSGLNSGPWPIHYKFDKKGKIYNDTWA